MAREQITPVSIERRCPNCGTRVARDAETCFMCGHDLRIRPRRSQRISLVDTLLVLAVVAVLVVWWRMGSRPQAAPAPTPTAGILLQNVPLLSTTVTPTSPPEPTATATAAAPQQTVVTHRVQNGETLLTIADQYGITVAQIQTANQLPGEFIRAGQELQIPIVRTPPPQVSPVPTSARFQYTVRAGDTVVSIAVNFGSTVDDILALNNLTPRDIIRPDDVLVVPLRQAPPEVAGSAKAVSTPTPPVITVGQPTLGAEIYIKPQLIGPPDGAIVARTEPLLLRWVSVDILAENEWYVLLISPVANAAAPIPSVWTKATSHRLDLQLAPEAGATATYSWLVSVARVKTDPNGQIFLEAASPPSDVRRFIWQ